MLSANKTFVLMILGCLMSNEIEKKRLQPNFRYYTGIFFEGLTKTTKILSPSNWRPG